MNFLMHRSKNKQKQHPTQIRTNCVPEIQKQSLCTCGWNVINGRSLFFRCADDHSTISFHTCISLLLGHPSLLVPHAYHNLNKKGTKSGLYRTQEYTGSNLFSIQTLMLHVTNNFDILTLSTYTGYIDSLDIFVHISHPK